VPLLKWVDTTPSALPQFTAKLPEGAFIEVRKTGHGDDADWGWALCDVAGKPDRHGVARSKADAIEVAWSEYAKQIVQDWVDRKIYGVA
jgi:hypothetical protein